MKKKLLITLSVVACALLLVVGSIAGTIAYLTSKASVENTFTVGNVSITLEEYVVTDVYGTKGTTTSSAGNNYKLIPGHTYSKEPVITVGDESENCWIFVEIDNGLKDIEVATGDGKTIVEQMTANHDWTLVTGEENVYAYKTTLSANQTVTPFKTFTLAGDKAVDGYGDAKILVTAYAIQANGFDTAEKAWAAASGEFNN